MIGKRWKVLDVGCGTGALGKYLKELECYVVGIEIDRDAAEVAKRFYDEVIVGDVEEVTGIDYPDKYFDAMVLADILEHLKRPDILLAKLKRYLKPEGLVLASIPNIARLEVRLKLFFGKFDYEETGILDKTYLTLRTARELFERAGYKVVKVDYTGLASKSHLFRLPPTLFAYQFIIAAKVK